MGTTNRAVLAIGLLGALGLAVHLFATGRLTFPSAHSASLSWVTFGGHRPLSAGSGSSGTAWSGLSDETRLPASLLREAVERFVSHDGRSALILSITAALWSTYDYTAYAHPAFVLLHRDGATPISAWARDRCEELPAGAEPPTLGSLIGAEDRVIQQGTLPFRWPLIRVLDDGGYVLVATNLRDLDFAGRESIALRYDAHGRARWFRSGESLTEFTSDRLGKYDLDSRPRLWQHGMWVDEAAGLLAIVDDADRLHVLSLEDGTTRQGTDEAALVVAAIRGGFPAEREAALDLALARRLAEAVAPAREAFADQQAGESIRLRAACVLAQHGDRSGRELIAAVARRPLREREPHPSDVATAWRHLGTCLGAESFPLYLERLLLPSVQHLQSIEAEVDGLAAVGDAALEPALQLLLAVPDDSTLFWRHQRLLGALRAGGGEGAGAGETRGRELRSDVTHQRWDRLRTDAAGAAAEDLAALLARDGDPRMKEPWSMLVLPAARWAALHPRPEYAAPLGTFRAAFAVEPQCRQAWRDRVLAEVDAALAACGGR